MSQKAKVKVKDRDPYRIRYDILLRAIESGLYEGELVELLDGLVVARRTPPGYSDVVKNLGDALERVFPPPAWTVLRDTPLLTSYERWLLRPSIAVVRGEGKGSHAMAEGAVLVAEVKRRHEPFRRDRRHQEYAEGRIQNFLIVSLGDRLAELYVKPQYRNAKPYYGRGSVYVPHREEIPLVVDGEEVGRIDVGQLFARPAADA